MRLELAERLRCPRPHAPTPLIVVAHRTVERELLDGVAGCPVCYLEARFEDGDLQFPEAGTAGAVGVPATTGSAGREADAPPVDSERLLRLVALLGLAEPGGAVLLTGEYAAFAEALVRSVDVRAIVLAAQSARVEGVSAVHLVEPAVPFTDATFRAAALDAGTPLPLVLDAVRSVAPGGRVLGALPLERPAAVRELARDELEWVGEAERGASGVVPLRRA